MCIDDSNESQNVVHFVRSPLNFLIVSLGSFTLGWCVVGISAVSTGGGVPLPEGR